MKAKTERNQAIYEAYVSGEKVGDIAERFGMQATNVSAIAKRMGAEPRNKTAPRTKRRVCPKCHKKVDVAEARFCYHCGTDIRSATEHLIARIENVMNVISFLPESARDEMRGVLCDVIKELKKGEK